MAVAVEETASLCHSTTVSALAQYALPDAYAAVALTAVSVTAGATAGKEAASRLASVMTTTKESFATTALKATPVDTPPT